jgi:hypothetical protein
MAFAAGLQHEFHVAHQVMLARGELKKEGEEGSHYPISQFDGLWLEPRAGPAAALIFLPGLGETADLCRPSQT